MKKLLIPIFILISAISYGQVTTDVTVKASGVSGGGSADSSTFQTNYRADTSKVNLWSALAGKLGISTAASTYSVLSHTHTFASLTSKPTTLSGYGITDAYPLTGNPSAFLTSYTETDPIVKAISGLVKSNGTTISAATAGTDYLTPSGSAAALTSFPTFNQNTTGSAGSVANALSISAELISGGASSYNGSAAKSIAIQPTSVTNTMLAGSIDLTSKVTGLLPDANISSASTWNGKVSTVTTGNGVSAVNTAGALAFTLGAITPSSIAASGTVTGSNLSGTHSGASSNTNTGDETTTRINTLYGYTPANGANYLPITGGTLTGTGGAGFMGFLPQSTNPTAPASGSIAFARSTGGFSIMGTNGRTLTILKSAFTGDHTLSAQNIDYTAADSALLKTTIDSVTAHRSAINANVAKIQSDSAVLRQAIADSASAVGTYRQIYASNTKLDNTASTTTENTIISCTIPANSIGVNGAYIFTILLSATNNANNKTVKIKLNGTTFLSNQSASYASNRIVFRVDNRNSLSSQIVGANSAGTSIQNSVGSSASTVGTGIINTAAAVACTVTLQTATSTDAFSIESFTITAIK